MDHCISILLVSSHDSLEFGNFLKVIVLLYLNLILLLKHRKAKIGNVFNY